MIIQVIPSVYRYIFLCYINNKLIFTEYIFLQSIVLVHHGIQRPLGNVLCPQKTYNLIVVWQNLVAAMVMVPWGWEMGSNGVSQ